MLDEAESKIFAIAEEGAWSAGFQAIQPLLTQVVERIDELYNRDNQNDITGVPTGFVDLDKMTSGLQPGDLIMLLVVHLWVKRRFHSISAKTSQLTAACRWRCFQWRWAEHSWRCVCSVLLGGWIRVVCVGKLSDEDWPRLTHAIQKMNDAQLYIDETPALSSIELRARSRRLARQCGKLGLIIVDYLQLMSANSAGENRATEISEFHEILKASQRVKLPGHCTFSVKSFAGAAPEQSCDVRFANQERLSRMLT
jgi:replicative DNA helicase